MFPIPATSRWSRSASPTARRLVASEAASIASRSGGSRDDVGAELRECGPVALELEHRPVPLHGLVLVAAQHEPRRPARAPRRAARRASGRSSADGCAARARPRNERQRFFPTASTRSSIRPSSRSASCLTAARGCGVSTSTFCPTSTCSRARRDGANRLPACGKPTIRVCLGRSSASAGGSGSRSRSSRRRRRRSSCRSSPTARRTRSAATASRSRCRERDARGAEVSAPARQLGPAPEMRSTSIRLFATTRSGDASQGSSATRQAPRRSPAEQFSRGDAPTAASSSLPSRTTAPRSSRSSPAARRRRGDRHRQRRGAPRGRDRRRDRRHRRPPPRAADRAAAAAADAPRPRRSRAATSRRRCTTASATSSALLAQSFDRMRRQLRRSFRRLEAERDRLQLLLESLHEGVAHDRPGSRRPLHERRGAAAARRPARGRRRAARAVARLRAARVRADALRASARRPRRCT